MTPIRTFFQDEDATTSVEYAIMMALILMACIAAVASFGQGGANLWTNIFDELETYW